MIKGVMLDYDTADRIAAAALLDYRDTLKQQLESHANGGWLHPDDVVHNQKMIEAIEFVVKDFSHAGL